MPVKAEKKSYTHTHTNVYSEYRAACALCVCVCRVSSETENMTCGARETNDTVRGVSHMCVLYIVQHFNTPRTTSSCVRLCGSLYGPHIQHTSFSTTHTHAHLAARLASEAGVTH